MSFASQAREEIAQRSFQKDCCVRAAAYGIACFAKYFDAKGLVLQTEQQETVQAAQQLFARCGVQGEILQSSDPAACCMNSTSARRSRWPDARAVRHHGQRDQPADRPRLIRCQTCVSAYIGAAFCAAARSLTRRKNIIWNFLPPARTWHGILKRCWQSMSLPHRTRRNGVNLIYVKTGANVERLLSFMGAGNAAEEMHAQRRSNRCATRPTDRPTAIRQTLAKRPVPMRRP